MPKQVEGCEWIEWVTQMKQISIKQLGKIKQKQQLSSWFSEQPYADHNTLLGPLFNTHLWHLWISSQGKRKELEKCYSLSDYPGSLSELWMLANASL